MSLRNFLKSLNTVKRSDPECISRILKVFSSSKPVTDAAITDISDIQPEILNRIVSDSTIKTKTCLNLFNFILKHRALISFEPDIQTHVNLICRLIRARKFSDAENLLKSLPVADDDIRYPFPVLASTIESCCSESQVVAKIFNLLIKFYSDSSKSNQVLETFSYMKRKGIKIDERTCTLHLLSFKRDDEMESALQFFHLMIESGLEISVYSLTIMVDVLCSSGEIKAGRKLVEEMLGRGVKPNIITYNIMINSCAKRWNFEELDSILKLMEKEEESFNFETYKFLIDGFTSYGKIEEARKLVMEMHEKGFKVDTHLYNLMINGFSKLGLMEKAFSMFDEVKGRGLNPNADTYWGLINGYCRAGEMELALNLMYSNGLRNKGIEVDEVMFNTLIDGFYKKGSVRKAFELLGMMKREGFMVDISLCEKIATKLFETNRVEDAKMLLTIMVKKGVCPRMMKFTDSMNL